ncbi:MAG: type II toxin-antitoxin system VapC family toxin [Candidatus Poribacteria bacterium]
MSGNVYFLDTNAIIALLQGNKQIYEYLQNAQWIGISIINQIEFLVFPGLSDNDKQIFRQFLNRVHVIELSPSQTDIVELIIKLRQKYNLKIPDAVIAATAIQYNAKLITSDDHFGKIKELNIVDFT